MSHPGGAPLPAWAAQAIEKRAAQHPPAFLREAGRRLSTLYRERAAGGARPLTLRHADVDAYAVTRAPATFAAIDRALREADRGIIHFDPRSMIDAGAGPGTATWAALERWPSLRTVTQVDTSASFASLAGELAEGAPWREDVVIAEASTTGELKADLVVAGFLLCELSDGAAAAMVGDLWRATAGVLVIVEPGMPETSHRLVARRSELVRLGATIAAPCPGNVTCPLDAADWCHFSVRLPRSRRHRELKGGSAPFEDERFSYLVAVRPTATVAPAGGRVIGPPRKTGDGIRLRVCSGAGERSVTIRRRDATEHRVARRLAWGDPCEL